MRKTGKPSANVRIVRPVGMALAYVNPHGAPYRLVTVGGVKKGWSTLWKGRKKVWECNATFAAIHFEGVEE